MDKEYGSGKVDSDVQQLVDESSGAFGAQSIMLPLWQQIGDNFYVERATFTNPYRSWGQEIGSWLTTSYPMIARNELGNALGGMLRPKDKEWFIPTANGIEDDDVAARAYLEKAARTMRRAMNDRESGFQRATKEADHDYAAFGQCAISTQLNLNTNTLLYKCHHLRDMAWKDGYNGQVTRIFHKWKPTRRDLIAEFGKENVCPRILEDLATNGDQVVNCVHVVVPADTWRKPGKNAPPNARLMPWVSVYVDVDNQHVMLEEFIRTKIYTIPRWQTVSGSPYAYSPATVCALPDARLLQAITLILLEAGEKSIDPTLLVRDGVLRSDLTFARATAIYVDPEYDDRTGPAVTQMQVDKSGLQYGLTLRDDTHAKIAQAFFLNKLSQPNINDPNMTAFQVGQIVQDYIRNALPLFEPLETEYNASICEDTFTMLYHGGAFGPKENVPQSLKGSDVQWKFQSPISQALETQRVQQFADTRAILAEAVPFDKTVVNMLKVREAVKDTLAGARTPAKWLRTDEEMDAMAAEEARAMQSQQMLQSMGQGAQVAQQIGDAAQALSAVQ
jgi:hypothetical protein